MTTCNNPYCKKEATLLFKVKNCLYLCENCAYLSGMTKEEIEEIKEEADNI